LRGLGVEADPALAALAAENFAANGLDGFAIRAAPLDATAEQEFDHALANPPYHAAGSTPSPDPRRRAAKRADPGGIADWIAALARRLRPGGTLTLALPPARLPEALAALAGEGCGAAAILPLWPRTGRDAKLLLLRAVRGGRAPFRLLPGLVLHGEGAGYTPEADAILRDGAPLPF
jgi:tRNA1(Val) A37 N6-methylase TrmN6